MTENYQAVYKNISEVIHLPVIESDDIKMGDLTHWDVANDVVRTLNGDVNVATLLGVAAGPNDIAHHGKQKRIAVNIMKDKIVRLKILGAEAIKMFTPVYWGGDAQTITTVVGTNTNIIGHIMIGYDESDVARTTNADERVYVQLVRSYAYSAQSANI